jgi:hypothetical protein
MDINRYPRELTTEEDAQKLKELGPSKVDALKQAVVSKDISSIMDALSELDEYLTGATTSYYRDNNRQRSEMIDELSKMLSSLNASAKAYLSDGGISRLLIKKLKMTAVCVLPTMPLTESNFYFQNHKSLILNPTLCPTIT